MEKQQLIHASSSSSQMPLHGVAPTQVRLDLRFGVWRSGEFDPCIPFLLRGRVSDTDYTSTILGLNDVLRSVSKWRSGMWLGVFGSWAAVILLILSFTMWDNYDLGWTFVCNGFIIFFAFVTIFSAVIFAVQLRRRVEEYLAQANLHYNPLGLNFRIEKQYRQWSLVIDILPQLSTAFPQDTQHVQQVPVMMQPAYYYPNPAGMAPYSQAAVPYGQAAAPYSQAAAPYGQAAYQRTSEDNV